MGSTIHQPVLLVNFWDFVLSFVGFDQGTGKILRAANSTKGLRRSSGSGISS